MTRNTKMTITALTLTLAFALSGCAGPGKTTKAAEQAPAASSSISGKVVETMDAGGYTYLCLEKDGKKTWVAAPVMKASVGQEINLLPGAEMLNFSSKALNRTFDKIIFSGGLAQAAEPTAASSAASNESAEPILVGKVVETMNAAQYTYINLEKDGKTAWAAVPSVEVSIGDVVELMPGTVMGQFTSKSLNRTFKSMYFTSGLKNLTPKKAALTEGQPKADPAAAPLPAGHPKIDAAAQPAAQPAAKAPAPVAQSPLTGKVVETADSGGYTYICLEKEGKKTWLAVPTMKVSVGQEMALAPGVVMSNFVSKSLNRTFDKIVFSSGLQAK